VNRNSRACFCYFAFGEIMTTVVAPTCEQLSNEELPLADRKVDDSWRHGVRVTAVYRRDEDGTFWQASYRLSTDGETNELSEGLAKIVQVFPREINVTIYESR
jgi:hypothetical protein